MSEDLQVDLSPVVTDGPTETHVDASAAAAGEVPVVDEAAVVASRARTTSRVAGL
jgi:hypothetical protein